MGERSNTAEFGNWGLLGAIPRLSAQREDVEVTARLLMGKRSPGVEIPLNVSKTQLITQKKIRLTRPLIFHCCHWFTPIPLARWARSPNVVLLLLYQTKDSGKVVEQQWQKLWRTVMR